MCRAGCALVQRAARQNGLYLKLSIAANSKLVLMNTGIDFGRIAKLGLDTEAGR
jgi:hypothetical protein